MHRCRLLRASTITMFPRAKSSYTAINRKSSPATSGATKASAIAIHPGLPAISLRQAQTSHRAPFPVRPVCPPATAPG